MVRCLTGLYARKIKDYLYSLRIRKECVCQNISNL